MVIIKCKKCKIEKAESEFRIWRNRLNSTCNECRDLNNTWYLSDKDSRKTKAKLYYQRIKNKVAQYRSDLRINRKYSLSRNEWNDILAKQNGLCGICHKEMQKPCVDHDHQTGKVRGLLHRDCNLKLQSIEDEEFFKKAQIYLNSMKIG